MIVCHCKVVRENTIREAIRNGARSRKLVARQCGAGSACGGCSKYITELIDEENRSSQDKPRNAA
ncbi:MAG: (2Fe-2S)-binding protein [Myxococcales bacterium]|nr:MAG: (2Fe-2S)-binding protein [Myxococcales bacterium]